VAGLLAVVAVLAGAVAPVAAPAAPIRLALRPSAGTAVELILENVTDKPLEVPKAVRFHLGKGMYWAPAYMTAGAAQGSIEVTAAKPGVADSTRGPVRLARRESRKVAVQLADLKWGQTIGGSWPNQTLAAAVPSGPQSLVVELSFENAGGPIRSNEAAVSIPKR
jgi:hypothetical protein